MSMRRTYWFVGLLALSAGGTLAGRSPQPPYPIVDTGQARCYNNTTEIAYPRSGAAFFGQDAHYAGHEPAYKDNGDGTVSDLVTGLMWTQSPGRKVTFAQAVAAAPRCRTGGYRDWRLPTIKELYSLILFSGVDPDIRHSNPADLTPFIDAKVFDFHYGRADDGDRIIDSQYATATRYVHTTMRGNKTMFGVNFADGRIKGYPIGPVGPPRRRREKTYYVLYVRGNPRYGKNDFVDNGDGTVTDRATALTWMKVDSGHLKAGVSKDGKLNWPQALAWAEGLSYAGHSDWRLPNAKELQSLVDYARSPDTTHSAAIAPVFQVTPIRNEGGQRDFPCYWTSTTHTRAGMARAAVYLAFGRALGFMQDRRTGRRTLMDVHGAGAQRSDDKSGDPSRFPQGRGPQGDVVRIYNFARCVRGGLAQPRTTGPAVAMTYAPPRRGGRQDTGTASPDAPSDRPVPPDAPPGRGDRISGEPGAGPDSPPTGALPPDAAPPDRAGQGPPSPQQFIRRHDRNHDGKVSRQEFPGPPDHFRLFDKNHDGYLTPDEAPHGPPPNRRQPPQR